MVGNIWFQCSCVLSVYRVNCFQQGGRGTQQDRWVRLGESAELIYRTCAPLKQKTGNLVQKINIEICSKELQFMTQSTGGATYRTLRWHWSQSIKKLFSVCLNFWNTSCSSKDFVAGVHKFSKNLGRYEASSELRTQNIMQHRKKCCSCLCSLVVQHIQIVFAILLCSISKLFLQSCYAAYPNCFCSLVMQHIQIVCAVLLCRVSKFWI